MQDLPAGPRLTAGLAAATGPWRWETYEVTQPPNGLPTYRVLTGPDDEQFCCRVSEALALGYRLHQGPAVTHNGTDVIVAQALLWPTPAE
jgi:hypothetical protein